MTLPDCRQVAAWLPLYVGDDLADDTAHAVRRHLPSCQACAALLADYKASQRWLRLHPPASIAGAQFDDLRRRVASRLPAAESRGFPLRLLERHWEWQRRWSARPALAMLGMLVLGAGSRLSYEHLWGPERLPQTYLPSSETVSTELSGRAIDPGLALAEPEDSEALDDVVPGDKVRMEIQTRDPRVKIIWFASREKSGTLEN